MQQALVDAAGHQRQPVTLPGYHAGRPPRNKGRRYPADPPTVEEIIAVMRCAGLGSDGARLRALTVLRRPTTTNSRAAGSRHETGPLARSEQPVP